MRQGQALVAVLIVLNSYCTHGSNLKRLPEFVTVVADGSIYASPFCPSERNWTAKLSAESPKQTKKLTPRIVGGRESKKGEVPYLVLISLGNAKQYCGGVIYNRYTIITAAHCGFAGTSPMHAHSYAIVAGEHDLNVEEGTEQSLKLKDIILHPDYQPSISMNDVAIMKLASPLNYSRNIRPIPIPEAACFDIEGSIAVSGFGYTRVRYSGQDYDFAAGASSILKITTIKIISDAACEKSYKESDDIMKVVNHKSTFCAGGEPDKDGEPTDACQGDSGGPAVCVDVFNRKYLCGLVSTGVGCGITGFPGIYTRISTFANWIIDTGGGGDEHRQCY